MPDKILRTVGVIYRIPLSELHPHPQNPFAIRDDPPMRELTESVQKSGVLVPAIVRPRETGGYEIIAGHRRKHACEQSGLDSMPVIILELNDNESVIQMVDEKKIALNPAYQIAALSQEEQALLLETMDCEQATPSLSQAQRMKKLSLGGELNEDTMLSIMMEQKRPVRNDITLSGEKLRKYFPRSYSLLKIEETIFKLLDAWLRKRQRDQSR